MRFQTHWSLMSLQTCGRMMNDQVFLVVNFQIHTTITFFFVFLLFSTLFLSFPLMDQKLTFFFIHIASRVQFTESSNTFLWLKSLNVLVCFLSIFLAN